MKVLKYGWLALFLVVFGLTPLTMADTVEITPDSGVLNTSRWEGNETSQAQIDAVIGPIVSPSTELYKQNVGGSESGALASSYTTTFDGAGGSTISWDGGAFVGPTAYLLVKDGNQVPAWYLFDLTALGWDGMEDLVLSDFWPAQGAISHVSLYGTTGTSVPEPVTLTLLGLGLPAAGVAGRRRK